MVQESQEEKEKRERADYLRRLLGKGGAGTQTGTLEEFLNEKVPLYVRSSNVDVITYNKKERTLIIEYLDGSAYEYYDISPTEAQEFYFAPSKGEKIWSILRVKGTKDGHRKRYLKIK